MFIYLFKIEFWFPTNLHSFNVFTKHVRLYTSMNSIYINVLTLWSDWTDDYMSLYRIKWDPNPHTGSCTCVFKELAKSVIYMVKSCQSGLAFQRTWKPKMSPQGSRGWSFWMSLVSRSKEHTHTKVQSLYAWGGLYKSTCVYSLYIAVWSLYYRM